MRLILSAVLICLSSFAGNAEASSSQEPAVLSADFSGTASLHPAGPRKAALHVRSVCSAGSTFAVLNIADEHGVFTNQSVYRFSEVQFDANSGLLLLRYKGNSGFGLGDYVDMVEATLSGRALSGTFTSNQLAPDGELIEGDLQFTLVRGGLQCSASAPVAQKIAQKRYA